MALPKKRLNVQPYKFGELVPSSSSQTGEPNVVKTFEMKSLKDAAQFKNNISDDVIRKERGLERQSSFSINPLVREHRGIIAQEEKDTEEAIQAEVERRVNALYDDTKNAAFQAGHQEGYEAAYKEGMEAIANKVDNFMEIMEEIKAQVHGIIEVNKTNSIHMIKNLTKWVALKEIEDQDYLVRLLNKLILEMNAKTNLIIRVNKKAFKYMPEVIEKVQEKLGELTNVRVEVNLDLEGSGIILESENGIIDASIEAQMKSLDKIFEFVGSDE